jgi:hypothetical protein
MQFVNMLPNPNRIPGAVHFAAQPTPEPGRQSLFVMNLRFVETPLLRIELQKFVALMGRRLYHKIS